MSMLHRHHNWFPLVIAGLTLTLFLLMFYSFTAWPQSLSPVTPESTPVSTQEYQRDMKEAVERFINEYEQVDSDVARLVRVESMMNTLLNIRVPADEKERHLSLVITLNQLKQALRDETNEVSNVFESFRSMTASYVTR